VFMIVVLASVKVAQPVTVLLPRTHKLVPLVPMVVPLISVVLVTFKPVLLVPVLPSVIPRPVQFVMVE